MILIAINSRTVASQVERFATAARRKSVIARTLAEARAALAAHPIKAIILDDWFPDGTGQTLLKEVLRDEHPEDPNTTQASSDSDRTSALVTIWIASAESLGSLTPSAIVARQHLQDILPAVLTRQLEAHQPETSLANILVVDDSSTYRELLRQALLAAGYTVLLAETGEEGVRLAFENPPDAMLVDSMLPGIHGADVIRRIRAETSTRRTPCLLLTASEDKRQELEALEAGADTFVRKDEAIDVILARLAGILRSASTPAATSLAQMTQLPRRVALIGPPPTQGPGALDSLAETLLAEGCETLSLQMSPATLPHELLARCAALEPDILLLAAIVDDQTLTFCRDCKRLPALRNSRLLVLDQAPGRNDAVAAIQAGADDYLPAGTEPSVLLARAKSQLRRKRVEDENRGLREHMLRQELENEAQRVQAEARGRHAEEMRVAYGIAEEKAHEAERARLELEQITEGIPQIVWTSTADGRSARFNGRWTDFTGLPRDHVPPGIWRRAIHPEDFRRATRDWVASYRGGLPYSSEYRLRAANGDFRWFLVRAIPLTDESGQIDRWFGTCTDVHEQRLAEEALRRTEKLAATGRLAASIAHEINNPLEAVTNLLYLIEMNTRDASGLPPDTHGYVTAAQKELDRVAQISKKTLAFYRESTNAAPVDLCGLIHEVADIYSTRFERKSITLDTDLRCETRPEGLAGELRQVLSNLVTNAIDASDNGARIRVRIRPAHTWPATPETPASPGVRISVGDFGHGIPPTMKADMFKPFITTKGQKGTGLGLWLSHSIITRHGGTLRLKSSTAEHHHGTCFSIFLPLKLTTPPTESDSMGTMLKTIGGELLATPAPTR